MRTKRGTLVRWLIRARRSAGAKPRRARVCLEELRPRIMLHGGAGAAIGGHPGRVVQLTAAQERKLAQTELPPQIDYQFISNNEGGQKLTSYVPQSGHSGVTIATGVDLGQNDPASLNIPQELKDKLEPYSGSAGPAYMAKNGRITISPQEADELDQGVDKPLLQQLIQNYDAASHVPFNQLPPQAQTVIADLYFQYGPNSGVLPPTNPNATPVFWHQVTHGDWAGAVNNLRNFGDSYAPRRLREATRLEQLVPQPAPIPAPRHSATPAPAPGHPSASTSIPPQPPAPPSPGSSPSAAAIALYELDLADGAFYARPGNAAPTTSSAYQEAVDTLFGVAGTAAVASGAADILSGFFDGGGAALDVVGTILGF